MSIEMIFIPAKKEETFQQITEPILPELLPKSPKTNLRAFYKIEEAVPPSYFTESFTPLPTNVKIKRIITNITKTLNFSAKEIEKENSTIIDK